MPPAAPRVERLGGERAAGIEDRGALNAVLTHLPRIRWGVILALLLALLVSRLVFDVEIAIGVALGLLGLMAIGNVFYSSRLIERSEPSRFVLSALATDIVLITALLHVTGGAENPMSSAYMLYVTLAALLLGPRATAGVVFLCAIGYGSLFFGGLDVGGGAQEHMHHHHHHGHHHGGGDASSFEQHLYGMFGAFVITAALVAYFVQRLSLSLRSRERELTSAREREERAHYLAMLGALSAGAAHELATPLGTIALVAGELEARAAKLDEAELLEDARLIREEIRRSRAILDALAERAGKGVGEASELLKIDSFLRALIDAQPEPRRARITLDAGPIPLEAPPGALRTAIEGVVNNAFEIEPDNQVLIRAREVEGELVIAIRDHGPGMDAETLARAKEPFYTHKTAHDGMGLGLYLTDSIVGELGGRLDIESAKGQGTELCLRLPMS